VAKPIVDGVEKQLTGKAAIIRLDVTSQVGHEAAGRYGVRGVPTLIVVDGDGQPVDTQVGFIQSDRVVEQVEKIAR
jgi:thioredoxin-like negative regulator of GroEL